MSNRKKTEADALVDLSKPDLRTLAVVLRNRKLWPPRFVWDYNVCWNCAMGLGSALWESFQFPHYDDDRELIMPFGLSADDGNELFYNVGFRRGLRHEDVTPEMVADKIDEVLALQEV